MKLSFVDRKSQKKISTEIVVLFPLAATIWCMPRNLFICVVLQTWTWTNRLPPRPISRYSSDWSITCQKEITSIQHAAFFLDFLIKLFTATAGGHIELMRFKEYSFIGCPGAMCTIRYTRSLFTRAFRANLRKVFLEKERSGKKHRCTVFGCNNDCLFLEKYTVKFSFCPKSARKYWEVAPWAYHK